MKRYPIPDPLKKTAFAGVSLLLAALFALIFMGSNSPLGPAVGSDNAIYLTMGTALKNGYAPYTQVFDHKGPVFFLIQTLPQLFSGGYSTLGIFIMEALVLWGCLLLIGAVSRHLRVNGCFAQVLFLVFIAPVIDGGNYCEEYSNLFTLFGALLLLRTFDDGKDKLPRAYLLPAFLFGAAFMISFLIRANNVLPMAGMLAGCALCLLFGRKFAAFGACAGGFVLGLAAVTLPVALWLWSQGALSDAIYGAFVHNMMYAETGSRSRVYMLFHDSYGHLAMAMAAVACLGGAAHAHAKKNPMFLPAMVLGAAGAGYAAFISHKFYSHYLMISAPLCAVGASMFLAALKKKGVRLPIAAFAVVFAIFAFTLGHLAIRENDERAQQHAEFTRLQEETDQLLEHVPESERLDLLGYRTEPKWYVAAKAMPYLKYYFLQEILAQADPVVMDEIVAELESAPPKWLVIFYNRPFSPPYDKRVEAIFAERYEFVDAQGKYQLLRLKDE